MITMTISGFEIGMTVFPGAPNDQIFPNTSQVPKMDFCMHKKPVWLIWSCAK